MICDEKYDICVLFCSSFVGRELINHVFFTILKGEKACLFYKFLIYKEIQECSRDA